VNNLYKKHQFQDEIKKPIKVAIFTDLHLDYDYTPGMNTECDLILCCRSDSGVATDPSKAAGKWGNENCDIPERTLKSLLNYIHDEIKPDVALWGGDSIPHNIDSLNFDTNVEIMKNVTAAVKEGLGGNKDFRIYPTIGNHDTYPQDIFKFKTPRQNEAVNQWIDSWDWMMNGQQAQMDNLKNFGFYSLTLQSANGTNLGDKLTKVISLNNNFCY